MIQININFIPDPAGVYIVGGTVRDLLLGNEPEDYDIVTIHHPGKLADKIAASTGGRTVKLGKPGFISYRVVSLNHIYDISEARGGNIESDLARRDFTVNAMALSAETGVLIDQFNGLADIRQKKIRMICRRNLVDDPLRMLRAFRLAAAFDFHLDAQTADAISAEAFRIHETAGERIRDELTKLFSASRSYPRLLQMDKTGLLGEILPEMTALKGCPQNRHHRYDVFDHTLNAFAALEDRIDQPSASEKSGRPPEGELHIAGRGALLKWAVLLHDIGKPLRRSIDPEGGIHFYGHEEKSAEMSEAVNRRLRFSARDQAYVLRIIRHHLHPLFLFTAERRQKISRQAKTRFFMRLNPYVPDVLLHALADMSAKNAETEMAEFEAFTRDLLKEYLKNYKTRSARPPLISGHDLIRIFGLPPSPLFSRLLSRVETERLSGNITSRNDALAFVKKLLKSFNPS